MIAKSLPWHFLARGERIQSLSSLVSHRQFAILQLRFVHQFTHAQIAHALSLCPRTIKSEFAASLRVLRATRGFVVDFNAEAN